MGSSASKAARKLPKRAEPPTWAGKRTPNPGQPDPPAGVTREQVRENLASAQRTEGASATISSGSASTQFMVSAIEKDARDPHFLANLQQLGPVKVDHHMKTVRPVCATLFRDLLRWLTAACPWFYECRNQQRQTLHNYLKRVNNTNRILKQLVNNNDTEDQS
jgi:hypothetical protein